MATRLEKIRVCTRPTVGQAMQWTGQDPTEVDRFLAGAAGSESPLLVKGRGDSMLLSMPDGTSYQVNKDDWIVKIDEEVIVCTTEMLNGRCFMLDKPATKVENCARCGGCHDVVFMELLHPLSTGQTHWAPCPATGEPIMMRIVDPSVSKAFRDAWLKEHTGAKS